MRLRGVRRGVIAAALVVLPALTGCGALGLGSTPNATSSADPAGDGDSWVVVQQGSATPSAVPTRGTASPTASASFLGTPPAGCPDDRSAGPVLIPLTTAVGSGSITASWRRQGDSSYRIAAVPQELVGGEQPAVGWQPVTAPRSGCTVTATVRGLTPGKPYVIWMDAPGTGFEPDGSPHPYSGRSGVLRPN